MRNVPGGHLPFTYTCQCLHLADVSIQIDTYREHLDSTVDGQGSEVHGTKVFWWSGSRKGQSLLDIAK